MSEGSREDVSSPAVADNPDENSPEAVLAIFRVGVELHKQGQLVQAEQLYAEVAKRDPKNDGALHFLGLISLQTKQPRQAVDWISKAIAVNPDAVAMYCNRATALAGLGRLDEGLEDYDRAISLQPDLHQAHFGRGSLLQRLERFDDAIGSYDKAISLNPAYAEAYSGRGDALYARSRLDDALASYDRAIELKPNHADAHGGRGNVLGKLARLDDALTSYDRAISMNPASAFAHYNRGCVLRQLRRIDEAILSYDRALTLEPDFAVAHHNRAVALLQTGQMEAGFGAYEWRKKCPDFDDPRYRLQRAWSGEQDISGKTLFIYPELYLGDMIQFCRYARMAEKIGARVVLAAPDSLHGLLRTLGPSIELLSGDATPATFDYQCALLSLPLAFRDKRQSVSAQVPYLRAEEERVARWKAAIGSNGFKLGVCWQGSTLPYAFSMQRSFPLQELRGLSRLRGVRLISLQKHDGLEQLESLPADMAVETLGPDFDAGPDAFLDAAAAMACCDLIITADTAVAHLAGALGVKTWVALPYVADWRWLLEGEGSPWYPTMRLFRQTAPGDWQGVFAAMETALKAEMNEAAIARTAAGQTTMPEVAVSWGELIDKITILEIKGERLTDPAALANVGRELAALAPAVAGLEGDARLTELRASLAVVNRVLWEIEDRIREKEARSDFGADFVELARSVYIRNDERAALKREINVRLRSDLVEEKSYAN
jgi:tetratricopeptide (TPR) repeat protein